MFLTFNSNLTLKKQIKSELNLTKILILHFLEKSNTFLVCNEKPKCWEFRLNQLGLA